MCLCMGIVRTVVPSVAIRIFNEIVDVFSNGCHKNTAENSYELSMENDSELQDRIYIPLIQNPIEDEIYFKKVDRWSAEEILRNRIDGSCLIRPYKEEHDTFKYILTVYAADNFFHLPIRKLTNGKYSLGQLKLNEKQFNDPKDIINYCRLNKLICRNKLIDVRIVLVPIT